MSAQISTILAPLFTITGAVALGMIMRATGIFKGDEAGLINRIVMTVLLPVFVFSAIKGVKNENIHLDILKIPLVALLVIAISGGVAYVLGRFLLHLNRPQMGAFLLTTMFGSTGFIGLPLVNSIYPNPSDPKAPSPWILQHAFYSELGSLTLLVTLGIVIASYYGEQSYGGQSSFSWRLLLEVPRNGPFLGLIMGLLFYTTDIPAPLQSTLSFLGTATLPLMMFSLGLTIVWRDIRSYLAPVFSMNFIKLIFAPVLALLLARTLGLDGPTQGVIMLNAATPSMIISLVYAAQYKLDRELASTAVFSSFFFCLVTIPLVALLLPPFK
ncbi:MAG TPA: AEC family transporter [Chloroflexia bacterium]|nr:AEC family transporter [Chloroflexia bacterium]